MEQKIKNYLSKAGFKYELSHFYLHKTNKDDYYSIVYKHMGTGIHVPESEIDEEECKQLGIQICKTWIH